MIGNLLPDFVRGRKAVAWHPAVAAGAARHRRVDRLTDSHGAHWRACGRLKADHGRFTPILVDVMFDHCLAVEWAAWHAQPLRRFVDEAYAAMLGHRALMPTGMRPIIERMASEDWLGSYATVAGMRARFEQMAARFDQRWGRSFCPAAAVASLAAHREALAADFREVFGHLAATAIDA